MELKAPEKFTLASLPPDGRTEVQRLLRIFAVALQRIGAGERKMPVLRSLAQAQAMPFPTFYRKWLAWQERGVDALVNRARFPGERAGLPAAFKQWLRAFHELHKRDGTGREVHRKVIAQWRAWRAGDATKAIPGYASPPEPLAATGLPFGWSEGNLNRRSNGKPTAYELTQRRIGTRAAKALLPSVRRTRVGLEFMQLVQIDDQTYDVDINLEGINQHAMRPAGFNAFDVLSGNHFAWCAKPMILDEVADAARRLTEEDCVWFVIHWLTTVGYRADIGTTIRAEHGTAAIKHALEHGLGLATDGKVLVERGGMTGMPLLRDLGFPVKSTKHGERLMAGKPAGNPNHKADLEGSFALFRTLMAHFKGPTGTRDKAPEENYAMSKYNSEVLRWAAQLPKERADKLMMTVLGWQEFMDLLPAIVRLFNERTWHELEGWEECGFTELIFRPDPVGDPDLIFTRDQVEALPSGPKREFFLSLMAAPGHGGSRRLSPHAVFQRHRHLLTRLDRRLWNVAIPKEFACETAVRTNHEIHVRSRLPGGRDLVYMARARTKEGYTVNLHAGDKVRVYACPFCPEEALVCDASDRAIGLVTEIMPVSKLDRDGALRTYGSVRALQAELDRETAARAAATEGAERAYMIRHNRAVRDGEPLTDEERDIAAAADDHEEEGAPEAGEFVPHGTPEAPHDPLDD